PYIGANFECTGRTHMTWMRTLAGAVAGGVVATALIAGLPAHAVDQQAGIGSGRAVIRIDVPSATVQKVGKNAYRMVLPPGYTGQWMGERTNARGTERTLVRDLTAGKLANRWTNFRYTTAPANATLTWNRQSTEPGVAVIMLSAPTVTPQGVSFGFTSRRNVPGTLTDASLGIARAARAGDKPRTQVQIATVTGSMTVWINPISSKQVYARIYDASGSNCWGGSSGNQVVGDVSVGSGTCAGNAYTNSMSDPTAGIVADLAPVTGNSCVIFYLNVTPPNQAMFQYSQGFEF
ncbi:MAG: hypothetical protein ACR2KE_10125, partial [Candidatus Nanopelagicales bacterium]